MSLNAIATQAALEPGPLVTRCRDLTVAKVESIVLGVVGRSRGWPAGLFGGRCPRRCRSARSDDRGSSSSGRRVAFAAAFAEGFGESLPQPLVVGLQVADALGGNVEAALQRGAAGALVFGDAVAAMRWRLVA